MKHSEHTENQQKLDYFAAQLSSPTDTFTHRFIILAQSCYLKDKITFNDAVH